MALSSPVSLPRLSEDDAVICHLGSREIIRQKAWEPAFPWKAEDGDSFVVRSNYCLDVHLVIFCTE